MSRGIRLKYNGENTDDGSVVNGFKIIKALGRDFKWKFLCISPVCQHECVLTRSEMRKSATGMCRECSWKLPNTVDHGQASRGEKSPTHNSWRGMKERCDNPKNMHYARYGGAGISYQETWKEFSNFFEDMGERAEGTTLDRINPDLGYFKENCRWADKYVQAQNKKIRGRGIRLHQDKKGWVVTLGVNGEKHYLGYYQDYEEALEVRKEAEIMYYGKLLDE